MGTSKPSKLFPGGTCWRSWNTCQHIKTWGSDKLFSLLKVRLHARFRETPHGAILSSKQLFPTARLPYRHQHLTMRRTTSSQRWKEPGWKLTQDITSAQSVNRQNLAFTPVPTFKQTNLWSWIHPSVSAGVSLQDLQRYHNLGMLKSVTWNGTVSAQNLSAASCLL